MAENIMYSASLLIIILASMAGVFSPRFDDNLMQRIGLSLACLGAILRLLDLSDALPINENARYLLTYGVAFFSVGTALNFWGKS